MLHRIRQPKPAARFEVNEAVIAGPAPRIGQHSQDVLRELGYGDAVEEIRAGYATRDRQRTTNAITDAMAARICTFGSAPACQARRKSG